jgi:hypothetical protein
VSLIEEFRLEGLCTERLWCFDGWSWSGARRERKDKSEGELGAGLRVFVLCVCVHMDFGARAWVKGGKGRTVGE